MLRLARRAMEAGGVTPAVFNAANEIAVGAFLGARIPFLAISQIVEQTISRSSNFEPSNLQAVLSADAEARRVAESEIVNLDSPT
jgi:1-deoxy-D-xylulose-5-phosphate reductoisomerase